MRETPWHPSAWIAIGTGIRKVQDVGAHRRRVYGRKPSVEEELWKRVFWFLIGQDRIGSVMLGRPCMTHQEEQVHSLFARFRYADSTLFVL